MRQVSACYHNNDKHFGDSGISTDFPAWRSIRHGQGALGWLFDLGRHSTPMYGGKRASSHIVRLVRAVILLVVRVVRVIRVVRVVRVVRVYSVQLRATPCNSVLSVLSVLSVPSVLYVID